MSKARILVVDDEPAVLKVLVTRLQLAGYQVYSATNGEEALESFHTLFISINNLLIHISPCRFKDSQKLRAN